MGGERESMGAEHAGSKVRSWSCGVDQSYQQARELYELAACQGNAISQFRLGIMYQHGQGVDQSNEQAKEYYEAAARQGLDFAQFNLGALSLCKWSRCRAIH